MHSTAKMTLAAILALGVAAAACAQTPAPSATVTDPVGPVPPATSIPFTLPKDIKWTGQEGVSQMAIVFGDPNKEGPYGVIYRWYPGNFSRPHFHNQTRYIYVVSGTWWVSYSTIFDPKLTYPMHAGTVVTDIANTVHWDGARAGEKEPAVIFLTGVGPMKTTQVGEDGKPLPAAAAK